MIKITRFSARNFLSFKKITYELPDSGLIYVGGVIGGDNHRSNGAGKSSMWEVVPFALYGKTVRGLSGAEVIHWGEKSVTVKIEFSVGECIYTVERVQKKRGQSINVTKDGEVLESLDVRATQASINHVLQMSYSLFINSVIFGQGLSYRFTQAPDAEKKEIFEQLLDLGWTKEARQKAKAIRNTLEAEWTEMNQRKSTLEVSKLSLEQEIVRWGTTEVSSARFEQIIEGHRVGARNADVVSTQILADIVEYRKVKTGLVEQGRYYMELKQMVTALRDKHILESGHWKTLFNRVISQRQGMNDMRDQKCPTCFQLVGQEHIANVTAELEDQVSVYESAGVGAEKTAEKMELFIRDIGEEIPSTDMYEETEKAIRVAQIALNEAENNKVRSLEQVKELTMQMNQALEQEEKLQGLKDAVTAKSVELDEIIVEMVSKHAEVETATFWYEGFGNRGVKSLLLDSVTEWMNATSTRFASKLSGDNLIPVFSSTKELVSGEEKEEFSVNVKKGDRIVPYKAVSGGEKRRVDVIVLLTLYWLLSAQAGKEVNLLVFDEVFESLDAEGIEQVVSTLNEFRVEGKCVYVVSHQSDSRNLFAEELFIEKDAEDVSRIL